MQKKEDNVSRNLIRKYLDKGFTSDAIEKSFAKAGYNVPDIDRLIKEETSKRSSPDLDKKKKLKRLFIKIGLVLALPIVILLVYLIFFNSPGVKDCGSDTICFSEAANDCLPVKGYILVEGSKLLLEEDKCTLKKQLTEFSSTEPEEVQVLFRDKIMTCQYTKGNFDDTLLDLTSSLDKCEGDLKDVIINLRLASTELEE
jgi:hypothetical protein